MDGLKIPAAVTVLVITVLCVITMFLLDYLLEAIRQPDTAANILGLFGLIQLIVLDWLIIKYILSKTIKK